MAATTPPTAAGPITTRRWTPAQIGALVASEAAASGADPLVLLATIDVESGFNNLIVGDGGTSFGLFQHHIGGAGGATRASAQRYLDPAVSIPERARALASARTGADVAAVQRPADRAGYARKIDGRLTTLRRADQAVAAAPSGGGGSGRRAKWSPLIATIDALAAQHGLRGSSNDRTPAQNAAVGGAANSDHLTTNTSVWARDYAGAMSGMVAFNRVMRGRSDLKQVIGPLDGPSADHMDHVHVAGNASSAGASDSGMQTVSLGGAIGGTLSLGGALGAAFRGSKGLKDDVEATGEKFAGAIGDVGQAIKDAVENLLKGGFRYSLIIALVLVASVLVLFGTMRTFGVAASGRASA